MTQRFQAYTVEQVDWPAVQPTSDFSLGIRLYCDYEQVVDFRMGGVAVLGLDEPPPLGHGWGPSPAQMLGSALGADLAAALLRCLRAAHVDPLDLRTEVSGTTRTDTLGRPHVSKMAVRLTAVLASAGDVPALPTPERLAEQSAVAGSLRSDVGLHVAIVAELRAGPRPRARNVVQTAFTLSGD